MSIKRDAVGDYWIIIAVRRNEESSERKPMTGKTAGFDFGMKHFLTQDNGTRIESPLALFNHLDELRRKAGIFPERRKVAMDVIRRNYLLLDCTEKFLISEKIFSGRPLSVLYLSMM